MTLLKPRGLTHRGVVDAVGFHFDLRLLSEEETRKRILSLWAPGAIVSRMPDGLILHLPAPRQIACSSAPGLPLTLVGKILLAAPLNPGELQTLQPPEGSLILVRAGVVQIIALSALPHEDPASWLDVSAWQSISVSSLGSPPAKPHIVEEPGSFDSRLRMSGVPKEDPERAQIVLALREAASGRKPSAGTRSESTVGQKVAGWLQRMVGKPTGPVPTRPPGSDASLREKAQWFAARMAQLTGLADVIGRRQAEYIARMMEMFERGDYNEGLRHAIAMGEFDLKPKPPALGMPTARTDLTISLQPSAATTAFHLVPDLHKEMKAMYRKAFQQLEAAGRIDEAAFTLAELLGEHEEAIAFLERHKKVRLAAELAEGRNMPSGLIVRLWFLAEEKQRAVQAARRTGAFADAILRLEKTGAPEARELRILWAETQAAAGDFEGALATLHPLQAELMQSSEGRERVIDWMDQALAQGGKVAARMLAKKLAAVPEAHAQIREQALSLLEDTEPEAAAERQVFAVTLPQETVSPTAFVLARAAVRSTLRDAGVGLTQLNKDDFQRLLRFSGDGALRADLPTLPTPQQSRWMTGITRHFHWATEDGGALPLYDVVFLPGGRSLIGLGEAGMRLLTPDGRTITHFDSPAHRLVVSDFGHAAIALAPRGGIWSMTRLDLIARKAEAWKDAELNAFAADYDGSLWFVAIDKDFLALDMTSKRFEAIWRLPHLEGKVVSIARSPLACSFLTFQMGATDSWGRPAPLWSRAEGWTHALPSLYLRDRKEAFSPPLNRLEGTHYSRTIAADGGVFYLFLEGEGTSTPWTILLQDSHQQKQSLLTRGAPERTPALLPPLLSDLWILASLAFEEGMECRLVERKTQSVRALFDLRGATQICARFTPETLILGDDRGRLLVFDLQRGEMIRDLRIHT